MPNEESTRARDPFALRWSMVAESLTRPYPVSIPMLALVSMVPFYIFIGVHASGQETHSPELAVDRLIPLQPAWALVYGSLYLWLILLPILVIRQRAHIDRTVFAYLTVWITAYVFFLAYPTAAPRPDHVSGEGFAVWSLRVLYSWDPPYNCFPSLHVAHSFVSALTCWRIDRRLGATAVLCATLVAISTLFTKQHYVADVIAGALLAFAAYLLFLRRYPRELVPDLDRRAAPLLALLLLAPSALAIFIGWVAYRLHAPA